MKKLVAFALVLSLGVFCAVGCTPAKKTTDTKKTDTTTVEKKTEKTDTPPVTPPKSDEKK